MDSFITAIDELPCFISKKENLSVPVVGCLLLATQSVLVDRNNPNTRKLAKLAIEKKAKQTYQNPNLSRLVIFPEGTTTNGECLISFKPGAFAPGLPVQPVCLRYPSKHFDMSFSCDTTITGTLLGILLQFVNFAEIHYLPVYQPSEEEKKDPFLYARNVRDAMAKYMRIRTTDHSYEDVALRLLADKMCLGREQIDSIVFNELRDIYHMDFQATQNLIKNFAQKRNNEGLLDEREFSSLLGLPFNSPVVQDLFHLFDKNGDGTLDFSEFVVGLATMNKEFNENSTKENTIEKYFSLFDTNGDKTIDFREFTCIMEKIFPGISRYEVQKMFEEVDLNKDEKISYEEFSQFAIKNPIYFKIASKIVKD
eukprot:TRINITY_DN11405_c0_g1_i1.p1 TRINITY_DN11405_c0_g1~~TRINITY_DN11405_c0_g1_i1.p1  ORF type:complete len:367 (+),score=81.17 TRINITY_DN11405_c0_g1_i1:479-1579(+)